MAPLTAWLPVRADQECDVVIAFLGRRVAELTDEIEFFSKALTDQGLHVLSRLSAPKGTVGTAVLRLRAATHPLHSVGHGCDVLVCLEDDVPNFSGFGLQRGSVLLWDAPDPGQFHSPVPDGVITYRVPHRALSLSPGGQYTARALVALGALCHLLGLGVEAVRHPRAHGIDLWHFDTGVEFARRHLVKRDVFYLAPPTRTQARHLLLTMSQAVKLGLAFEHCDCGSDCLHRLASSTNQWLIDHLSRADHLVSLLQSGYHPGVRVYRGPEGRVLALLGGDESILTSCADQSGEPTVLVASGVADAVRLLIAGRRLLRAHPEWTVGIVIEDCLAASQESIAEDRLADLLSRASLSTRSCNSAVPPTTADLFPSQREGDPFADIGYVAWGAAQGVVREAVELCQQFGLPVAALYPSVRHPFPTAELETFSRTVRRVVVVEGDRAEEYSRRIARCCSFQPGTVRPDPGHALSPMDIFLREGLGAP